jgi:periplasmic protein TonB
MNRDLIIGAFVALVLHAGLALSGEFFQSPPAPAPVDTTIPIIELAPLPPDEPETVELSTASGEPGGDLSDLVPPMQADNPAPTASSFVQRIQPPPPPGIARSTGAIVIPSRPGAGIGTGTGLQNLFDLASLDQPPAPRTPIRPIYPTDMSRSGINGEVVIGFMVDSEGNVRNAYVIRSSRHPHALQARPQKRRRRQHPQRQRPHRFQHHRQLIHGRKKHKEFNLSS